MTLQCHLTGLVASMSLFSIKMEKEHGLLNIHATAMPRQYRNYIATLLRKVHVAFTPNRLSSQLPPFLWRSNIFNDSEIA